MIFFLSIPFLFLLLYTRLSIQTALLRREIRSEAFRRDELLRKNTAIKREIADRLEEGSIESFYMKKSGSLPFYLRNKVVRVDINAEND